MSASFEIKVKMTPDESWALPPANMLPVARAVQNCFRDHFTQLSMDKSSRWWGEAARAVRLTQLTTNRNWLMVVDYPGVALHYYGGRVEPVEKELLTIPANDQAKGKSALEFQNLQMVIFPHLCGASGHLQGMLVQLPTDAQQKRFDRNLTTWKKGAKRRGIPQSLYPNRPKLQLTPMFWLLTETNHQADETVLPSDAAIEAAVDRALPGALAEVVR